MGCRKVMRNMGRGFCTDPAGSEPGVVFAGHAIVIAIHWGARAVFQEKPGFGS